MPAQSELNLGKKFGEVADIYDQFRTDYPRDIFVRILAAVAPPHNRLVDLGVGTGKMARRFLGEFDEIVGVEPDVAMAEKLRKLEPRIQVRIATAEEVVFPAASVDLVTVAHALHWMDATAVLSRVTEWLRPAGIFAICGGEFCSPRGAAGEVVKREFEECWNACRDPRSKRHFSGGSVAQRAAYVGARSYHNTRSANAYGNAVYWVLPVNVVWECVCAVVEGCRGLLAQAGIAFTRGAA